MHAVEASIVKPGACSLRCGRLCIAVVVLSLVALSSALSLAYHIADPVIADGLPLGPVAGAVPNRIMFVYPVDLLSTAPRSRSESVVAENMRRAVAVLSRTDDLPPPEVVVLDSARCADVVARAAGRRLLRFYNSLKVPSTKWDICRAAALYADGGILMEPDLQPRFDVRRLFTSTTGFSAVLESSRPPARSWYSHLLPSMGTSPPASPSTGNGGKPAAAGAPTSSAADVPPSVESPLVGTAHRFVPSFVAATPKHPVLRKLMASLRHLASSDAHDTYAPGVGMTLLYRAYEEWHSESSGQATQTSKLFRQAWLETWGQAGSVQGGMLAGVERQPSNGGGCNIVVYDPMSYKVPFYLHSVGTPACPAASSGLRIGKQWWK